MGAANVSDEFHARLDRFQLTLVTLQAALHLIPSFLHSKDILCRCICLPGRSIQHGEIQQMESKSSLPLPSSDQADAALQDPGTGIQPFLPPVPATSDSPLLAIYRSIARLAAVSRFVGLVLLGFVYGVLVEIPERILVSCFDGVLEEKS
jgi:hypothetical protein